jgi:hypothetical protein
VTTVMRPSLALFLCRPLMQSQWEEARPSANNTWAMIATAARASGNDYEISLRAVCAARSSRVADRVRSAALR